MAYEGAARANDDLNSVEINQNSLQLAHQLRDRYRIAYSGRVDR